MESLTHDIRYGFRTFTKRPGVTALILLLMALGTAVNTAVFSLMNAAVLRRLPGNYDRLVVVSKAHPRRGSNGPCRPANFFDWKAENKVFESATSAWNVKMDLTGAGEPERLDVSIVLEDFFAVLGVPPLKGRTFEQGDYDNVVGEATQWDAVSGVAVLSYPFWQRRFGGDPAALGKTITLNGNVFTIVGIMPRSFQGLGGASALWLPWTMPPAERHDRETHLLFGIATLKRGTSLEQAQIELAGIYERLQDQFPEENRDWSVQIQPWRDVILGDSKLALFILLAGAFVVLLIACANVAGLLLGVGASRGREVAVRLALGAGQWRIARQFLTESLLLATVGGTISVITAFALTPLLSNLHIPTVVPFAFTPRIDTTMLAFVVVVSCSVGVLSGSVPALRASRLPLRASSHPGSRRRPGALLIVSETALATVLLVAGGLVLRSFVELQRLDPGFAPQELITMAVALPRAQQELPEVAHAFQESLLEQVSAIPDVHAAAISLFVPLKPIAMNLRFQIRGRPSRSSDDFNASAEVVSDDYFRTIGATLVAGRYLGAQDTRNSQRALVISETMAREYWPNENAIGERLVFPYPDLSEKEFTIVGIIRDVTHERLDPETKRTIYMSQRQEPHGDFMLIVRTDGEPMRYAPVIKERIQIADPSAAVSQVAAMDEIAKESLRGPRLQTSVLSLFAGLAVFLAASGLYGLLAHSVSRRTREIAVRMALGADARKITQLVTGQGLALALTGLIIGIMVALATTRFFSAILYGLSPTDSTTLAIATAVILVVSCVAAYVPARRAARLSPTAALRYE